MLDDWSGVWGWLLGDSGNMWGWLLEQLLRTTVHGVRHHVVGWQVRWIPFELFRSAAVVARENKAKKGCEYKYTKDDENRIGV